MEKISDYGVYTDGMRKTMESIEKFWDFVFNSGFQYIAIRDMAMSKIDISVANQTYWNALHRIHMHNKNFPDTAIGMARYHSLPTEVSLCHQLGSGNARELPASAH